MDWSEKNLCIKCNEGGNLLFCSENGCPLAIHEGCMGCPARFDDTGHFYCPYCLYKQAVEESRQAREYALARKKALLIFMNEETIGNEKHLAENKRAEVDGHNQSKVSATNANMTTCDDGKSRCESDAILDQSVNLDEEQKISDAEEEKIQEEEEPEASAGSKGQDPLIEMHEEQKISNTEEKEIQEEKNETSAASTGQDPSIKMHKHDAQEEEKIQEKQCETSSASTGEDRSRITRARAKREFERSDPIDMDTEASSLQSKLVKQSAKNKKTSVILTPLRRSPRMSSSGLRTEKLLKVDASRKLKQPHQPSVKLVNDIFGNGKRKRLLWTEKEEEMLRAGVQKYSNEPNKNLPWRKILGWGQGVFDVSRTPSDLKDKWRSMTAK